MCPYPHAHIDEAKAADDARHKRQMREEADRQKMAVEQRPVIPPPEQRLAAMLKRDLGVVIEPRALRLFLQGRWSKVAALAHQIHEDGADG